MKTYCFEGKENNQKVNENKGQTAETHAILMGLIDSASEVKSP